MINFPFSPFHSLWGQPLEYQKILVNSDFEGEKRIKSPKASFIVQQIKDESIKIQYNITNEDAKKFWSSVKLEINDKILFQNKSFTIVGIIDQYPNGPDKQWGYIAMVVGENNEQ